MKRYFFDGKIYDSRHEAAIGGLLQKYMTNLDLIEGQTLHARSDKTTFDFVLSEAIIEWHPKRRKGKIWRSSRETLDDYVSRKQNEINSSSLYKDKKLIVISNVDDFYNLVLLSYGKDVPPPLDVVRSQFSKFARKAKGTSSRSDLERIAEKWRKQKEKK